ncbi:hypothetical protein PENSPDRAFT_656471 [Peniophora sp. CONT]|nr:hypothetical protein PENSPDRAFT_656471 [Peniophora sp. CONT]
MKLYVFLSSCFLFPLALAQSAFHPGNIPLVARSTYLNARINSQNLLTSPSDTWPGVSTATAAVLGWAGYLKVDNTTYRWLGNSGAYNNGTVTNMPVTEMSLTATRTIFTMTAGTTMSFNITFLSPIEVGNFDKWSRPFSYVAIEAKSLDGLSHNVQIYSDISGEWLSGDRGSLITWQLSSTSPNIIHNITLSSPQVYTDILAQANWGAWYYATSAGTGVTYQIDSDVNCRSLFQSASRLNNTAASPGRAINDRYPVFAMSYDLGTISSTQAPVVWAIGNDRETAIQITDLTSSKQDRALYYRTNYTTANDLLTDVLSDYSAALSRAEALDANLTAQANSAAPGNDLANLISLAARQVIANTELTVGRGSDGSWNKSDVMLFMREGDIDYNRTQPVELLYSAFPLFMALDPALGAPLLEPLMRLQSEKSYVVEYAAPDLGSKYPNATIENNEHQEGVEMTGNMLIMAYAQARFSGDSSLVETYYSTLRSWADYLVKNSLSLETQLSTDTTNTRNQTNLAIKGIIGVGAFAQIANSLGVSGDGSQYGNQAKSLYTQWKASGALSASSGLLAMFGQTNTYATGYNLFADRWLGLDLVEDAVYTAQTSLVKNLLGSGTTTYGIPVDSTAGTIVDVNWDFLIAGAINDTDVTSTIAERLVARAGSNTTGDIWPISYDSSTGALNGGGRSSVGVGAAFAPMALTLPAKSFSASKGWSPPSEADSGSSSGKKSNAGAIAGGVVGGIVGAAIIGGLIWFFLRRRRENDPPQADPLFTDGNGMGFMRKNSDNSHSGGFNRELLMRDSRAPSASGGDSLPVLTSPNPSTPGFYTSSSHPYSPAPGQPHSDPGEVGAYSGQSGYGGGVVRPLPSVPVPLSSKALMELRHAGTIHNAPLGPRPVGGPTTGSSGPTSSSGASSALTSSSAAEDVHARRLRQEVDLLRREMAEIRAAGLDLPPTYEAQ